MLAVGLLSGCAREKFLMTADGVRMAYDYVPAQEAQGVAVLVHGLGSSYDEWYNLKGVLNEAGWTVIAVDLRGHGSSTEWNRKEINWRYFSEEAFRTMVQDIQTAVDFSGNPKRLWLIGSSFGANLSLYYAAEHPGVTGVVLLSPGFNYKGIKAEEELNRYGARPLLIAGSEDDTGTVQICSELNEKAAGSKRLIQYKTAGHGSDMISNEKDLAKEIVEWMRQN